MLETSETGKEKRMLSTEETPHTHAQVVNGEACCMDELKEAVVIFYFSLIPD